MAGNRSISIDDINDALYELLGFLKVSHFHILVKGSLFAEFDRYWKPWNAADDALQQYRAQLPVRAR